MTSYVSIPNGDIDQDSPITQPLMTALRDNPIAIAEGDASVPESLRNTQLLGTLTTTSGTTQTLSGLNLTQFRSLFFSLNSVSATGFYTLQITSPSVAVAPLQSGGTSLWGYIQLDLNNGVFLSNLVESPSAFSEVITSQSIATTFVGISGYTTATTSIGFSTGGDQTFDSGSILVYGVK